MRVARMARGQHGLFSELNWQTRDEAGKALLAPCPDKEVEKYFTEFTPIWANIEYEIASRRTRYINDQLFAE